LSRTHLHALRFLSRLLASACAAIALIVLLGYASKEPVATHLGLGGAAMSPLTALALLALAFGVIARGANVASARTLAGAALVVPLVVSASRLVSGSDGLSHWVSAELFGLSSDAMVSLAAGLCIVLVAAPIALRLRPRHADLACGTAMLICGVSLLGRAYGGQDLQSSPLFLGLALSTAAALFALAFAALLANPRVGVAGIIDSARTGGSSTRRQLTFLSLPLVAGWVLATLVRQEILSPASALVLLATVTVVPLALLVIRDGWLLERLDIERDGRDAMQADFSGSLKTQLSAQATALGESSRQRTRDDAAVAQTQRLETVGRLTGGIAHDFNNLLMAISINLDLIRRTVPQGDRAFNLAVKATLAVEKGARLTGQLLTFSRSQRLTLEPVALSAVFDASKLLMGSALGPKITLELSDESAGAWLISDANQLENAILNLAITAREAMADGGVLTVKGWREERADIDGASWVAISVQDTGCGMDEDVKAHATEPFFTTRAVGAGTGLGLSQVYGLVLQCQGEFDIKSAPSAGTTVTLRFPAAAVPVEQPALVGGEKHKESTVREKGKGLVLLVDDDESVLDGLVAVLQEAGYDVETATDGPSALDKLTRITPDAAVLDFLMPGMNGAELARHVRSRLPELPIIFVSGYSETLALDGVAGAVVLRKPFSAVSLTETVGHLLH
jgi:signal transduction histidine kinase